MGVIVFDQFISLIVALLFVGVVITIVSYWLNKNDGN
ncbi:type I toxin-antitoxin system Fst family toxin [Enterococcus faecalis]|nr:type I toxin-antitoxin system Fst family toxin [Enterococcus faecalis]MBM9831928.1 type I toxin-antitoxin system Fst family toxin [Enterococcus faecalis]